MPCKPMSSRLEHVEFWVGSRRVKLHCREDSRYGSAPMCACSVNVLDRDKDIYTHVCDVWCDNIEP